MTPIANCGAALILVLTAAAAATAQVTTSQYDNFRSGATLHEKILTPQNVNVKQFGKIGAFKVDGPVYAQPLFLPSVEIPGKGMHDVLFVATEHDSVYAFDANRPAEAETVYWEDLRRNKESGWSLFGLMQALKAQGKNDDAALVEARFKKAWAAADVKLISSRFGQ